MAGAWTEVAEGAEQSLRELGFFSLEKSSFQEDLIFS